MQSAWLAASLVLTLLPCLRAQVPPPLRFEGSIPLPDVRGRIDHFAIDAPGHRLFVAALGNNTVEVMDLKDRKRIHSIGRLHEPQGLLYLPSLHRLYVANGGDGTVRIFDGLSYTLLKTTSLGDDADNIRYDPEAHLIYVGYGSGGLAVLHEDGQQAATIRLDAHPESFQLEKNGSRIWVNLPSSHKIAVVDRRTKAIIAKWGTDGASANFPMALDESDHRLFVVCRKPAELLVFDTQSGRIVASSPAVGDCDDVFYDRARRRIYASGGNGAIFVFQQQDPDHYALIAEIPTAKGARTSFYAPEFHRLYVAARQEGPHTAVIRIYATE